MKCTIKFDGYNNEITRKSTVTMELRENEKGLPVFSVCGEMRGYGGQCLNEISKYNHSKLFNTIYRLWKNYHLNDMHAGTPEQEKAIEIWEKQGNKYDYTKACEYLKKINLYEINGYKYGHSWLYQSIPEHDLNLIKTIIEIYK